MALHSFPSRIENLTYSREKDLNTCLSHNQNTKTIAIVPFFLRLNKYEVKVFEPFNNKFSLYIMLLDIEMSNIESLVNRNNILVKKIETIFTRKNILQRFLNETANIYKEILQYILKSSEKPKRRYSI